MLLNNSNLTVTVTCLALCNLFPSCMDSNTSEGVRTLNMHTVHGFLQYISVLEHGVANCIVIALSVLGF